MLTSWADAGIDTREVIHLPQVPTGAALVMVDASGANYLTIAPGANSCVSPGHARACESLFMESDWIVLQMEIPAATNEAVLEIAARHRKPVLFNYAPVRLPPVTLGPSVHGLVVNEHEAMGLARSSFPPDDIAEVRRVAAGLRVAGGHRFAIVTLGGRGAVLADDSGERHVPGFKVSAVDTTAAGDTFCGALVVALAEKRSLHDAATFASAAAALCCTRSGAQPSIPWRREIEAFLEAASVGMS
jgi:ribokinase